ncbi:MAG: pre-peptidase C-terminal domain-containing protein [Planctomycetia bacterium]|nr:pre-peptidase C-terminal domain-containing protein [Planctomycetia bacterium]
MNRRTRFLASLSARTASRPRIRPRHLHFEPLEERRLLVVNTGADGTLDVGGDEDFNNQDDTIRLIRAGNDLKVIINGDEKFSGAFAGVKQINVFAGGGNDTLIVDSTNGLISVERGIRYDGDAPFPFEGGTFPPVGQGFDKLQLEGGAAQGIDTYSVGPEIGSGTSRITGDGGTQTVFFSNLEPVVDLVPAAIFVINGTPEHNAIDYTQGSVATNGKVTVDNYESVEFSNKTGVEVHALAGDDVMTYNNPSTPTGLTAITFLGEDGNDQIRFGTNASLAVSVSGGTGDDYIDGSVVTSSALALFGDDGNDTLVGGFAADNLVGGPGDDTMIGNAGNNTYDGLAGINTIVIRGTQLDDLIEVEQTAAGTLFSSVNFSPRTETFSNVQAIRVEAGAGADRISVTQADALVATPGVTVPITVLGGAPAAGDRLLVTDDGIGDTTIQRQGAVDGNGSFQVGPLAPIYYEDVDYAQLGPINDITGGTGSDGLGKLVVFKHDPYEDNNSLANAWFLGSGKTINVDPTIDPGPFVPIPPIIAGGGAQVPVVFPADVDWFRFVAAETGTLDMQVYFRQVGTLANGRAGLPGDGNLDIQIFDAAGNKIGESLSNDDDERVDIPVVRNQTYYLRVFSHVPAPPGVANAVNVYNITAINVSAPIPQLVDLQAASDSGRSDTDNITKIPLSTFDIILDDDRIDEFTNLDLIPDTINNDAPDNDYGVQVFNNGISIGFAALVAGTNRWVFTATAGDLQEGHNNFISAAVWIRDRANPTIQGRGDLSVPLQMTLDTTPPLAPSIFIDPATTDTGVPGFPTTIADRVTSNTAPGFTGRSEADTIVRLWADGPPVSNNVIDASDVFEGLTVAVPLDGDEAFPNGQWNLTPRFDLNDPLQGFPLDGHRQITATAEDIAGNESSRNEPTVLNIFIDTQGPQVRNVFITAAPAFDLFDPKPTNTPTPLVSQLSIAVVDLPNRSNVDPNFLYSALFPDVATNPGLYQLVGDYNGIIPIRTVQFIGDPPTNGNPATGTIVLTFFEPLPDDRYTLTLNDDLVDPAGNKLDGESNAQQPLETPTFPSGDKTPGGDFVARFTIDSRPELGVWSAGTVYIDTNGNGSFDPQNLDFTNRDITYVMRNSALGAQGTLYTSDDVFAGNFTGLAGGVADGFDKLAAYGKVNGQFRFLVNTDNTGVPSFSVVDPAAVNGVPFAGRFDNDDANGDEVGLFDGTKFYFDTNHDYKVDLTLASNLRGYPIAGDFDGDGFDDLGTWADDKFTIDLAKGVRRGWDGVADATINFGFIGVRERPVAADMDKDGIDDLGLWVPDRSGAVPSEGAEWFFLVSNDPDGEFRVFNTVNTLDHPYKPVPFGKDLFFQFGDDFAIPVVGNFDPPLTGGNEVDGKTVGYTNPDQPLDVNADGVITAMDALLIISELNNQGAHDLAAVSNGTRLAPPYLDSSGDGFVTPIDALMLISYLNHAAQTSEPQAAAESVESGATDADASAGGAAALLAPATTTAAAAPASDTSPIAAGIQATTTVNEVPRVALDQIGGSSTSANVVTTRDPPASAVRAVDVLFANLSARKKSPDSAADVVDQEFDATVASISRDVALALEKRG